MVTINKTFLLNHVIGSGSNHCQIPVASSRFPLWTGRSYLCLPWLAPKQWPQLEACPRTPLIFHFVTKIPRNNPSGSKELRSIGYYRNLMPLFHQRSRLLRLACQLWDHLHVVLEDPQAASKSGKSRVDYTGCFCCGAQPASCAIYNFA